MKRLFAPFALLGLLSVFLAACTNNSKIIATGLSIELTALAPQADGTVKVSWQVVNQNIVSYLFSRVRHTITVNGMALGTINDLEPLAVPATTHAARTSVLTPKADAATLLQNAGSGPLRYEVDTKITILIYGDTTEDSKLSNRGTVTVTR